MDLVNVDYLGIFERWYVNSVNELTTKIYKNFKAGNVNDTKFFIKVALGELLGDEEPIYGYMVDTCFDLVNDIG